MKILLLLAVVIGLSGCAKTMDQIDAQGGLISSEKAPYIVIKQSGGRITDVYKLLHAIVQSEAGSDGWLFLDQSNRPVHIGGDMKSIRFAAVPVGSGIKTSWNCYNEYHMEFETQTYEQLYGAESAACFAALNK